MDMFETLADFYSENLFTDLKIVSGKDRDIIECHLLVILGAVPGLRRVLAEQPDTDDPHTVIIFPDVPGGSLKAIVTDIYDAIVQPIGVDNDRIELWSELLGVTYEQTDGVNVKTSPEMFLDQDLSDKSKPKRIRKRVKFDDFEESDPEFEVKKKKKKTTIPKRKNNRPPTENRLNDESSTNFEEFDADLDLNSIKTEDLDIIQNAYPHMFFRSISGISPEQMHSLDPKETMDIVDNLEDELKQNTEKYKRDPVKDEEFGDLTEDSETDFLDQLTLPSHYDQSDISDSDSVFADLTELVSTMLDENSEKFGKYFVATTKGTYIRDGFATHFTALTDDENQMSIPLIPISDFAAIFAISTSNGVNIASPVAFHNSDFSQERTFTNFLDLIKKQTGASSRTILEYLRPEPFKKLNRGDPILKYQLQFQESSFDVVQSEIEENQRIHEEQDKESFYLQTSPLPEKDHCLKFCLMKEVDTESVMDYVIVHGDSIDNLKVQSYLFRAKGKGVIPRQLSTLTKALAAFCGLSSIDDLFNIEACHDLVVKSFDLLCKKAVLRVIRVQKMLLMPAIVQPRLHKCPHCNLRFTTNSKSARRAFEEHKLTHIECDCGIEFTSDAQFKFHLSSVHLKKKSFKCEFGSCNQYFRNQHQLERHYNAIHTKSLEDGVGVICAICGQTFVNQHYLRAHNLCYHKEFPCTVCNLIIIGKNAQEKHHRDVHATFDDHLCQHCGRGFKLKKYLQIHIINAHTLKMDKPFPCHLCEKGFNNHMKLTQHLDGVHFKRKPYKCRASGNICNMAFAAQSTRKRHEKVAHKLDIRLPQGRKSTSKVNHESFEDK